MFFMEISWGYNGCYNILSQQCLEDVGVEHAAYSPNIRILPGKMKIDQNLGYTISSDPIEGTLQVLIMHVFIPTHPHYFNHLPVSLV